MKLAIARFGTLGIAFLLLVACGNGGTAVPHPAQQIGISSENDSIASRSGEQMPAIQVPQAALDSDGEGKLIVNVNTATREELETIPGIGPELAKRIIIGRPYGTVEELIRVKGIGEYTLGSIRPYVK
ncbi:MAG: ComEA family DNA-binding protein, partial [Nitrospirales bacterium]